MQARATSERLRRGAEPGRGKDMRRYEDAGRQPEEEGEERRFRPGLKSDRRARTDWHERAGRMRAALMPFYNWIDGKMKMNACASP
eukprot:3153429-Pleurochrysis_carterae.AAC.2